MQCCSFQRFFFQVLLPWMCFAFSLEVSPRFPLSFCLSSVIARHPFACSLTLSEPAWWWVWCQAVLLCCWGRRVSRHRSSRAFQTCGKNCYCRVSADLCWSGWSSVRFVTPGCKTYAVPLKMIHSLGWFIFFIAFTNQSWEILRDFFDKKQTRKTLNVEVKTGFCKITCLFISNTFIIQIPWYLSNLEKEISINLFETALFPLYVFLYSLFYILRKKKQQHKNRTKR